MRRAAIFKDKIFPEGHNYTCLSFLISRFFQVLLPLRLTNTFLTDSYTDTVAILSTLWDSQAYMTGCMAHKLCHVFDGAIYTFVNYFRLDKDMQQFSWKS